MDPIDSDPENNCPKCATHPKGRYCLSHTCPDCGSPSFDVEFHSIVCEG